MQILECWDQKEILEAIETLMAMDILIAIETLEVKETYKAKNTLKAIETFDSKKSITQSKKYFINLTQSVKSLILEMLSHLKRRNLEEKIW